MRTTFIAAVALAAAVAGCIRPDRLLCPPDAVIVPTDSRTEPTGLVVTAVGRQDVVINSYRYGDLRYAATFTDGGRASGTLLDAYRANENAPLRLVREQPPTGADTARLGATDRLLTNGTRLATLTILDVEGWILVSFPPGQCLDRG